MKVIIPGLHNSDENHWQSHLEKANLQDYLRIHQENWDEPDCATWIEKIEIDLVDQNHSELILIGHSIGCIAILKWFELFGQPIKGALLVAPSDAEKEGYPTYITGFNPIPMTRLPFPSIVVGSSNDYVTSLSRTKEFAAQWGSRLVLLEDAGHIESKSGFGRWDLGVQLIQELANSPQN